MATAEDLYPSYDDFLRTAMKRCWERKTSSKATFLALMLASRHAWGVAIDKTFSAESGKKVLTGAASAAAVAMLIRTFLGGPIGILLGGASVASLVAVYGRDRKVVTKKVVRYRELIGEYKPRYEDLAKKASSNDERNLMLDGLMTRLLDDLDEPIAKEVPVTPSADGFAAHVKDKQERAKRDEER